MKKRRSASIFTYIFIMLLLGCVDASDKPGNANKSKMGEALKDSGQGVVYSGPGSMEEIERAYGVGCGGGVCVVTTQPHTAPIKKANGSSICALAKYEAVTVVAIYISREDAIEGADCEISPADYSDINKQYGEFNVYKRYLDQQMGLNFKTWRTEAGFVTTYKEIVGRDYYGGIAYQHHVYVGFVEHRNYSIYVAR